MIGSGNFSQWFKRATGQRPYAYQRALGEADPPPAVLEIPTGAGKTAALICSWLYARKVCGTAPRRLVYALPMRSLVEQVRDVAAEIRHRLGLDEEELGIRMLMGGADRQELRDWREWPEHDQILVGTIDMLLSRALGRGYAEGRYEWPIAFGLLNSDCRWVFDEIQLMQAARITAAQLDGLRGKLGIALPCETIWSSATVDRDALITIDRPQLGKVLELPAEDRRGALAARLDAEKRLERLDLTHTKSAALWREIASGVLARHRPETRSIVVLNRVKDAQEVFGALRKLTKHENTPPEIVLLHSRLRPPERREHMNAARDEPTGGAGRIVVSTQVIEAGLDISAMLLATDTAPVSSIVQRVGRCNRTGEEPGAGVLWLDRGDPDVKQAAPYALGDVAKARVALADLVGESLSPARFDAMRRGGALPREEAQPRDVLRRRDLLDLFDTSPDISGMDVDVARFIRDDDERSVFVFFRDLDRLSGDQISQQPEPTRDELVSVPVGEIQDRRLWIFDPVEGRWASRRVASPGATVMLASADGGYDAELGWAPLVEEPVTPLSIVADDRPEALGDDRRTYGSGWMTLADHLDRAQSAARALVGALAPLGGDDSAADAVIAGSALHDVGKAHPAFQEMLRSSAKPGEEPASMATTLWAKSKRRRGGHNRRRHFRHELASALALRSLDSELPIPRGERDLATYLVAAHHGRVRLSIRPAPDERPRDADGARFALGVYEGDELPEVVTPLGTLPTVTLSLACMELGGCDRSWTDVACTLRDDPELGPFRLAFLEALVRIADWRAGG